ncbi:carboxynorspermidine decarboxylase [Cellulosilyticum lentocellum]|uniref:Carboxynorspermidine decarboxylase n=1 Tax=Cellulosilyticum lentocellum (strain ATCC 49066 / DSM 5427 / NCIMB 11756 / RHM5) TaxID=642492 RepID=F2JJZ7_CELLD|nr:carboxynorspermidine decarboxylase [Cellulosilyticum lentocellum]ADZ83279.1 carboxynorspermidine decarboxylase [Cellulosilyticum lentocellum DSM 5427]
MDLDFTKVPTPCYVVDERLLIKNLEILKKVEEEAGCRILLATKAFSMYETFPLIAQYLSGVTSSSLHEARLGYEEMGKEVHIYAAAYKEEEFDKIMHYCNHIVFNSFSQWNKYKEKVKAAGKTISCGLRINPEYAEVETEIYNPCAPKSRMGITLEYFEGEDLEGIEGLHFHAMCEQNSDTLERILKVVEEKFGAYLHQMKWINFGGGHHITRADYDLEKLIKCIKHIKETYDIEVYLEPGEAVALNTGYLVSTVLETLHNDIDIAILDTSAACHMPDVLEMPYRPQIIGSGLAGEKAYTYRLGSATCLAGDVIGDYSFDAPLKEGDRLVFCDMAHYTMVKNNTFNGINLPSIVLYSEKEGFKIIKSFGYEDFKSRL